MRNLARIVAILLAFALPLAMAADPPAVIGSWTLDLARSKYQPASAAPRSETRTYEMVGDSTRLTIRTQTADGRALVSTATYKADGKVYAISGNPNYDAFSLRRLTRRVSRGTLMRSGKVVGDLRAVTSVDGKTHTMTYALTISSGQKVHNILVFDRQQ